jgi:hypothetical protein
MTIFKFITKVEASRGAINEFLRGKLGRSWTDSLSIVFDNPDFVLDTENKFHYIHQCALKRTRDLKVPSTILIDPSIDKFFDSIRDVIPKYVSGQLLGLKGGGKIGNFFENIFPRINVSSDKEDNDFVSGFILGLYVLDMQEIGPVNGLKREGCPNIVSCLLSGNYPHLSRGFHTVVDPSWMILTNTDLQTIVL